MEEDRSQIGEAEDDELGYPMDVSLRESQLFINYIS